MAKEKKYNLSNKVTEAWALDDYYVKIQDQEICDSDIVDFEAVYGGCEVQAHIQFIDSKGITTGDAKKSGNVGVGAFIKVGWTTAQGCQWDGEFFVKKMTTTTNDKNQKLVKLILVDKETRNFKGTFKDKAHKDKEFSKGIKEFADGIKSEAKDFIVAGPKKELKLNLQIPAHIDFHTFIKGMGKKMGYKFIKDKFSNYLVHNEHLEFGKLMSTKNTYEYDVNQYSFNRIVQFNIDGFDMEAYLASIPTTNTSIDPITNQAKESREKGTDTKTSKKKVEGSKSDAKTGKVKASDLVKMTRGSKQGKITAKDKQYFNTLNNAQKCSIWVPGSSSNLVGKKVKVVFPKPTYYEGDDEIFAGEWEVYAVRDKVIGMYYMMELFLRRPGQKA
jgi:hypothetical protein